MRSMVNKVNGNNYYTYNRQKSINVSDTGEQFSLDYKQGVPQSQSRKNKAGSDEEDGVRLELSGSRQAASPAARPAKAQTQSGNAAAPKAADTAGQTSLLETLQAAVSSFFAAIRGFFRALWSEPDTVAKDGADAIDNAGAAREDTDIADAVGAAIDGADTTVDADAAIDDADTIGTVDAVIDDADTVGAVDADLADAEDEDAYQMTRERLEEEIRPYLRNKDMQQVLNLLTDNGRRTVAKNSTLLTYYDKKGRITQPTASDRERILYGDKNTRNL